MTATQRPVPPGDRPARMGGFGNLLLSEWTKLRSVRSTYWTALVAVLTAVGLGVLICARVAYNIERGDQDLAGFDPTTVSLNGLYLAQLAVGALGVLTISSEYGTGMIRATLCAVPRRRVMLAAKGVVFAAAVLAAGELMSFLAVGAGQALLRHAGAGASLRQPGVLRATVGGGLYLTAVGLLAFGLGALVRHTAGALSAFFGLMFVPSAVVDVLPSGWHGRVQKYMPANAGSQILTVVHDPRALAPWVGLAVFCLYALAAGVAVAVMIGRRDT